MATSGYPTSGDHYSSPSTNLAALETEVGPAKLKVSSQIAVELSDDKVSEITQSYRANGVAEILADRAFPIQPSDLQADDWAYIMQLDKKKPEVFEFISKWHKLLLEAMGVKDFREIKGRSKEKELIENTRNRILATIEMMKRFDGTLDPDQALENKKWAMDRYGDRINNLLATLISEFLPAHSQSLGQYNPVYSNHDIGELLLRACDPVKVTPTGMEVKRHSREQYEAKRKVVLMLHAMSTDHEIDQHRDHTKMMSDVFEERIYNYRVGEAEGATKTQWLISNHDAGNDNKCTGYNFVSTLPDHMKKDEMIEQIDFRMIRCPDKEGNMIEIEFGVDMNKKSQESVALKLLRDPDRPISDIQDLARCRLLFKDKDQRELAMSEIKRRLNDEKAGISLVEAKEKKMGKTTNRAVPIECKKLNLTIDRNGKRASFEMQAFIPGEYINYFCWKPHAWPTYAVKRFFNGVFRTLWPEHHYPDLDIEALTNNAIKSMYNKEIKSRSAQANGISVSQGVVLDFLTNVITGLAKLPHKKL